MKNNGNVQEQVISESGLSHHQYYSYDGVNRVTMASEGAQPMSTCPGGAAWCRRFGYDAYGNRSVLESAGITAMPGINSFDSSTNRLTTAGYDLAGGMTQDPAGRLLSYDVEHRMVGFAQPSMASNDRSYGYDGDGRRVRKTDGSEHTIYVYDAFGRLAAEYAPSPPAGAGGRTYRTVDALGSTRLVTDATSPSPAVLARHDFTPFGERIDSSVGGRPSTYGDQSAFQQQFTGQYRDDESDLDYFNARYLAAAIGRFTAPDAALVDQFETGPQSWNLYAVVRNNPLRFTDPSGLTCVTFDDGTIGDDGEGQFCDDPAAKLATADEIEVRADKGALGSAVALNSFFYINNLANDSFAFLFDTRPASLQNTPLSSDFQSIANAASYASIFVTKRPTSLARRLKRSNLPAWRSMRIDITHIASGHIRGGDRVSPLKTLFPPNMSAEQVESGVRQAYRFGEKIRTQGERVLVRGLSDKGLTIEMWVNVAERTIESAYPVF